MPRLRKRALSLLAGAGLLFFIGTNVQAGWLFVLAALILGAVAAGWLLPIRATSGVTISRRVPGRVHQGEETLVDLEIVNAGGRGRRGLIVQDPHLDAVNLWVGPIRAGERTDITTLRVAERRGRHGPDRVRLKSSAPFGVAERRRWVPVEGSTLVLPKVESLGALPFIEPAATTDHAIHSAPRRGQGPEYLGIREYRPGDSMRHVHWPSTARTGAVMVREFEFFYMGYCIGGCLPGSCCSGRPTGSSRPFSTRPSGPAGGTQEMMYSAQHQQLAAQFKSASPEVSQDKIDKYSAAYGARSPISSTASRATSSELPRADPGPARRHPGALRQTSIDVASLVRGNPVHHGLRGANPRNCATVTHDQKVRGFLKPPGPTRCRAAAQSGGVPRPPPAENMK